MKPTIKPEYPLIDVIKDRWSPRAFSEKSIEKEKIHSLKNIELQW
jgi:hypothetical protein